MSWEEQAGRILLLQEILPAPLEMHRAEIRPQDLIPKQVMTIVYNNPRVGMEPVNYISTPVVGAKNRSLPFARSQERDGTNRHSRGIEMCVHHLAAPDTTAIQSDHKRQHESQNRPYVPTQTRLNSFHPGEEAGSQSQRRQEGASDHN